MKHQEEELYKLYINHDPWMTLTYFKARETCWEYANGQKIYGYEKKMYSGGCLPLSRGYILVYDHNIQTSSSLKPLGQSKANIKWNIIRKAV